MNFMFTNLFYQIGYELKSFFRSEERRREMTFYRLITKLTFLQPRNVRGFVLPAHWQCWTWCLVCINQATLSGLGPTKESCLLNSAAHRLISSTEPLLTQEQYVVIVTDKVCKRQEQMLDNLCLNCSDVRNTLGR